MNHDRHHILLREDANAVFDPARFNLSRLPVRVAELPEGSLTGTLPCCLDMLVKLPGGPFVLPDPYAAHHGIALFMDECTRFENSLVEDWRDTHYAYLTVDSRFVRGGLSHRNGGWHFDGMQGARYPIKLQGCHQYVVSDRLTTEFTGHPTDAAGLDELRHNWFEELGAQVPEDAATFRPAPMEIMVMSTYQLHRSRVAAPDEEGWRTFLRLDLSLKQQDRLGNTMNPDLPAPFEFVPRSLPEGLAKPIRDAGWAGAQVFGATC